MSQFANQFAPAAESLTDFHGDPVTYRETAAAEMWRISALVGAQRSVEQGRLRRFQREFRFIRDSTGLDVPVREAIITYADQDWTIEEVVMLTETMATVLAGRLDTDSLTDSVSVLRNVPTKGVHGDQELNFELLRASVPCLIEELEDETEDDDEGFAHFARRRCVVTLQTDADITSRDRLQTDDGTVYAIESIDWDAVDDAMQITAVITQTPLAGNGQ